MRSPRSSETASAVFALVVTVPGIRTDWLLTGDSALSLDVHPVEVLRAGTTPVDYPGHLEHPVGEGRLEIPDDRGIGVPACDRKTCAATGPYSGETANSFIFAIAKPQPCSSVGLGGRAISSGLVSTSSSTGPRWANASATAPSTS